MYFIGLLRSGVTKEQNKHKVNRVGLGTQMRGGLESSSLPLQSLEPAMCNLVSLWGGVCQVAAFQQVPTSALQPTGWTPFLPDLSGPGSICLLPACCRGMRAQRETTLLRWSPALRAEEPGWEIQGTTLPCMGKEPGEKRGQGQPANKGPLALSWKKQQRRTKWGPPTPHPPPPPQHTCIFRIQRPPVPVFKEYVSTVPEETKLFKSLLYNQEMQI